MKISEFADRCMEGLQRLRDRFMRLPGDKRGLAVCVIIGAGAMLMLLFSGRGAAPEAAPEEAEGVSSEGDFILETQKSLEEILSAIDGVGETRVMITAGGSEEYIYAENESDRKEEKDHVILKKGSSEEALVRTVNAPKITGVVVVCEGGGSDRVKEEVVGAVTAALGIPAGSVHVAKMR